MLALAALTLFALVDDAPGLSNASNSIQLSIPSSPSSFSFAVVGHIRGRQGDRLYFLLDELVDELRAKDPDLVILAGDLIWGDVRQAVVDPASIEAQWDRLDAALLPLKMPIYRVPGNHDVYDATTLEIFERRYGSLPRVERFGNARFLLLNSAYVEEEKGPLPVPHRNIRGLPLDTDQQEFLRRELASVADHEVSFAFLHHLLWFDDESPWWSDVHPLLRAGGVRAVFSGEYGPMKFSHMERDGIDYLQTSMEGRVHTQLLRNLEGSRNLTQQFENFLLVEVDGDSIDVEVVILGALSSGKFSPEQWRAVHQYPGLWRDRARAFARTHRLVVTATLFAGFVLGIVFTRVWTQRQKR